MEILEQPDPRYSLGEIRYPDLWEHYIRMRGGFWNESEIENDLPRDRQDWLTLDPRIQHFIKLVLGFFAVSDGVVNETISEALTSRIRLLEARVYYNFQEAVEIVHNLTYNKLLDAYIRDPTEKRHLMNAAVHYPAIRQKVEWIQRQRTGSLAKTLFVQVLTEGLAFSSSFCSIFWIAHQYNKLPALKKANDSISRDEGDHTEFGIHLYTQYIKERLTTDEAHTLMQEAVAVEAAFVASALPEPLLNMNADLMMTYVRFVADYLLIALGYPSLYNVSNPFDFMIKQSIGSRMTEFFTTQPTEYGLHQGEEVSLADM